MSRCTGQCCTIFPLHLSWAEIQRDRKRILDGDLIADMVIPFFGPLMERNEGHHGWKRSQHTFTCKHFDGKNCGIYESRPRMCSDYGTKHRCDWEEECTLVPAKSLVRERGEPKSDQTLEG